MTDAASAAIPPDDPARKLTVADPDSLAVRHVAVVGDTYSILGITGITDYGITVGLRDYGDTYIFIKFDGLTLTPSIRSRSRRFRFNQRRSALPHSSSQNAKARDHHHPGARLAITVTLAYLRNYVSLTSGPGIRRAAHHGADRPIRRS